MTPLAGLFDYAREERPGEKEVREVLEALPKIPFRWKAGVKLYGNPAHVLYLTLTSEGGKLLLGDEDGYADPWAPTDEATAWQVYLTLPNLLIQFRQELAAQIQTEQQALNEMQQAHDALLKIEE